MQHHVMVRAANLIKLGHLIPSRVTPEATRPGPACGGWFG